MLFVLAFLAPILLSASTKAIGLLPARSFLEKQDLVIPWTHHFVRMTQPVSQATAVESITELELAKRIAQRLGIIPAHPELAEEPLSILAGAVRGAFQGVEPGTEIDRLLKGELLPLREFPVDEYRTPSSKLEFISSTAKEKGLSALPRIIVDTPLGVMRNPGGSNW